ncbi:MAG: hypothetical protein KC912_22645 [Proteobacteria bacterium]|nr:hypothetical protein [Pseudomonadota bacterium]
MTARSLLIPLLLAVVACGAPADQPVSDSGVDSGAADTGLADSGGSDSSDSSDSTADSGDTGTECVENATQPCGTDEGVCVAGTQTCTSGNWGACEGETQGSTETCNGEDTDCNGVIDDVTTTPAADVQLGVCSGAEKVCDGANGWVEPDYTSIALYEAVEAACDGEDNDCDGSEDNFASAPAADLQDGACVGADKVCDGSNGWIEPDYTAIALYEAVEATCDGEDNDCDGSEDNIATAPPADLQDGVCSGAAKACAGTGGWVEPDYTAIALYEAVESTCDGEDNDCNGLDDDIASAPVADVQDGVCAGADKVCDGANGWVEPDYTAIALYEAVEATCDGEDNDCDGSDDNIASAPSADVQEGVCSGAAKVCDGTTGWVEPDYTAIALYEAVEATCDGEDNDCNGLDDDIAAPPLADVQDGVCSGAAKVCDGANWNEPDYTSIPDYGAETCDGTLDENCDGEVDEGCAPLDPFQAASCGGTPWTASDADAYLAGRSRVVLDSATIQERQCPGGACGGDSVDWVIRYLTYSGGSATRWKNIPATMNLVLFDDRGTTKFSMQHTSFSAGSYPDSDGMVYALPPVMITYPHIRAYNIGGASNDYEDLDYQVKATSISVGDACLRWTAEPFGAPLTEDWAVVFDW